MPADQKIAAQRLRKSLFLVCALSLLISAGFATTGQAAPLVQEPTPVPAPAETAAPDAIEALPGIPVSVGGKTLFYIGGGEGDLSAVERAAAISAHLTDLANNPFRPPYEITVAESAEGTSIFVGDELLLTITEADARASGLDSSTAGASLGATVSEALAQARATHSFSDIAVTSLEALLVLGILVFLIWLINFVYHRATNWVDRQPAQTSKLPWLTSTNFYRSGRWKKPSKIVLSVIRWGAIVLVLVIGAPLFLLGFPSTRAAANSLLNLILIPISALWSWFVNYLDELITIVFITLGAYLLIRFVRWFFGEVASGGLRFKGTNPTRARFTSGLISALIVGGAVVMAFPYLPGADSPAFHAMVIFIGALITFSSTSAIGNTVSGILLVYTDAFELNEIVQIGNVQGRVVAQHVLTTELRTFRNETVTIPNSVVLNSHVTNYSRLAIADGLIMHTTITIGYDVPWEQVHELLVQAALDTPNVEDKPTPFVLQLSLNDYNVTYDLNCITRHPDRLLITYSGLHQNIQDQFNAAGIEILSPAYTALRDGNTVAIPEAARPADYQPPGFRIQK